MHFGVIGPRNRRQRERLEKEIEEQFEESECNLSTLSTGDYHAQVASLAIEEAAEEELEAERESESERDSGEDGPIQSSLHEERCSRYYCGPKERAPYMRKKFGSSHRVEPSRDIDPAEELGDDYNLTNHEEDIEVIDEDEPWRYELVRYYYSDRSPHVIQLDKYREHENYHGEELEPTNRTRGKSELAGAVADRENNIGNRVLSSLTRTIEEVAHQCQPYCPSRRPQISQGVLRQRRNYLLNNNLEGSNHGDHGDFSSQDPISAHHAPATPCA